MGPLGLVGTRVLRHPVALVRVCRVPWYEVIALLAAGMAAGTINTIVGAGTLITFPTLLFFGFPPLVANVSNTVGLVAGGLTGIHGYRRELVGQGDTLRRLVPPSFLPSSPYRCCWFCSDPGSPPAPRIGIQTKAVRSER